MVAQNKTRRKATNRVHVGPAKPYIALQWEYRLNARVLEDTQTGLQGLNALLNRCTFKTNGIEISLNKENTAWDEYPLADDPELGVAYVAMGNAVKYLAGKAMAIAQLHRINGTASHSESRAIEPVLISATVCRQWASQITNGEMNLRKLSMLYVTLDSYINEWERLYGPMYGS